MLLEDVLITTWFAEKGEEEGAKKLFAWVVCWENTSLCYVNLVVFFFFFLVNDQGRKTQAKLLCSLGIAVCRNASKSWGIIPQARQIIRFAVEVNKLVLSLNLISCA